jgi:hypothetical protein
MPEDLLSFQDLIDNLSEVMNELPGEEIARIYNEVCSDQIEYDGDSLWKRED